MNGWKTGTADLPLHTGKIPSWLFNLMRSLARQIIIVFCEDLGKEAFLKKLSDPFWFQAFGCALGFDWHSSGLTTTVCGAIKEALKGMERDVGLFVAGGKGLNARKTPEEIRKYGDYISVDPEMLVYSSRMAAKVDSAAVQDGYQLYHHFFVFSDDGRWIVVQQGMNEQTGYTRRYHWYSDAVKDFVVEPHSGIITEKTGIALNLVAAESRDSRETIVNISHEKPERNIDELLKIRELKMPGRHYITPEDINPTKLKKIFLKTYMEKPEDFERLLSIEGVGPKTIRALALISELIYGVAPSFRDPARFSYCHGGKDGHPYPIDRALYEKTIEVLEKGIIKSKIPQKYKYMTLRRLQGIRWEKR